MRPSVEETALALEALAEVALRTKPDAATTRAIERGTQWLVDAAEQEKWRTAAPVGFYFAKLWYHERLYPLIFTAAAFARLTAK
jgi:squalene-hopene/tetraprenyl-beta-curcumene cyclase